jgi:hypothetical protein
MKISESASYPHPVLAHWSGDISEASFTVTMDLAEDIGTGKVAIRCETMLDHPELLALLEAGSAGFGCFITCRETGFRRLQPFGLPTGVHEFAPGALLGLVQLRPLIWAKEDIHGYSPTGAHPEFGGGMDIRAGDILALDDEQRVNVLRPPVASIESIFEIAASDEVVEGLFEVDPGGDRVLIRMGQETYQLVQNLRESDTASRAVVMNSLYVPVVMEVLHRLSHGPEDFQSHRWFEPFHRRCDAFDVSLEGGALLSDAQKMLNLPFGGLGQLIDQEGLDDAD